jgi:hypothetical protein
MKKQTIKLETERLVLRKFKLSDAKDMFESYCSRDIVTKYLRWMPHKSIEDTIKYLTEIVLPSGVTTIGNEAFSACSTLKTVILIRFVTIEVSKF